MKMPRRMPAIARMTVSRTMTFTMYAFEAPSDLRIPISRSFHDCGVHRLKDHNEADADRDPDHNSDGNGEPRQTFRCHQAQPLLRRGHDILAHSRNFRDVLFELAIVLLWIIKPHIENRCL